MLSNKFDSENQFLKMNLSKLNSGQYFVKYKDEKGLIKGAKLFKK